MPSENLNITAETINTIVAEVVRRLRDLKPESNKKLTSDQASAAHDPQTKDQLTCTLSEQLITADTLRKHLPQARSQQTFKWLVVRDRAIVTPAVRDLLTDRGMTLVRESELASNANPRSNRTPFPNANLSSATNQASVEPNARINFQVEHQATDACRAQAKTIADRLLVRSLEFVDLSARFAAIAKSNPQLSSNPRRVRIVITEQTHAALWQFHQHRVRAARCQGELELQEALFDFEAEALVLDPRCGLSHDLMQTLAKLNHS